MRRRNLACPRPSMRLFAIVWAILIAMQVADGQKQERTKAVHPTPAFVMQTAAPGSHTPPRFALPM